MKLSHHYRSQGFETRQTIQVDRSLLEPKYSHVYGSAIFSSSYARVARFRQQFPEAIVGGTYSITDNITVEQYLGIKDSENYDYSIYPEFDGSIGFTQRGCRLKCGFCVVPKKEGKARSVNTIKSIWRGAPWPRHLHLLDNDFFGQPREQWEARIGEIVEGKYKVCINQGINIRMIDDESAKAIASIPYYDDSFKYRRLYTAWDNIGDEDRFFRGIATLERYGVPPSHVMAYMLVGYDRRETWERVLYRLNKMTALGIRPYPMVYGDRGRGLPLGAANHRLARRTLGDFQRWVIRKAYNFIPFEHYDSSARGKLDKAQLNLLEKTP